MNLFIHNSLSCGGEDTCPVACCQETGCGDHFLIHVEVALAPGESADSAAPQFPGKWHNEARWKTAPRQAQASLKALLDVALQGHDEHQKDPSVSILGLAACSFLLNCIAGILRDFWLGGRSNKQDYVRPVLSQLPQLLVSDCVEDLALLEQQLRLISDNIALLHKTFRLLKPFCPKPVSCMMREDRLLTEDETNVAWHEALTTPCGHHDNVDHGFQLLVRNRLRVLLDAARANQNQSHRDLPVLQREVVNVVSD